jgi:hypothetical protein
LFSPHPLSLTRAPDRPVFDQGPRNYSLSFSPQAVFENIFHVNFGAAFLRENAEKA